MQESFVVRQGSRLIAISAQIQGIVLPIEAEDAPWLEGQIIRICSGMAELPNGTFLVLIDV